MEKMIPQKAGEEYAKKLSDKTPGFHRCRDRTDDVDEAVFFAEDRFTGANGLDYR